jgi:hypothetical protein
MPASHSGFHAVVDRPNIDDTYIVHWSLTSRSQCNQALTRNHPDIVAMCTLGWFELVGILNHRYNFEVEPQPNTLQTKK